MTIERKNFGKLILLNCVTLGIYGAVMHQRLGNEINALCQGDNEQPRMNYMGTILLRLVPYVLYIILWLICSSMLGGYRTFLLLFSDGWKLGQILMKIVSLIWSLGLMLVPAAAVSILMLLARTYREYWWYKQSGRLKLNGWRFGLAIRERGTDTLMFRTLGQVPLVVVTIVSHCLHLLVPFIVCVIVLLISAKFAAVLAVIFGVIYLLFAKDCSAGAYLATYFIYKNINRIIDSGLHVAPFDPMGYEYYPSVANHYMNTASHMVYDDYMLRDDLAGVYQRIDKIAADLYPPKKPEAEKSVFIDGVRGPLKGYSFPLDANSDVFIGRDPAKAGIVIDKQFEKISGRHVGIRYDAKKDVFCVTDYSTNGTYVDGIKLEKGKEYSFRSGSLIELVDSGVSFRVRTN